jgi:hypothetical protein
MLGRLRNAEGRSSRRNPNDARAPCLQFLRVRVASAMQTSCDNKNKSTVYKNSYNFRSKMSLQQFGLATLLAALSPLSHKKHHVKIVIYVLQFEDFELNKTCRGPN